VGRILAIFLLLLIALGAGVYIAYHRADLVLKVARW
jgi:hypothetical protein